MEDTCTSTIKCHTILSRLRKRRKRRRRRRRRRRSGRKRMKINDNFIRSSQQLQMQHAYMFSLQCNTVIFAIQIVNKWPDSDLCHLICILTNSWCWQLTHIKALHATRNPLTPLAYEFLQSKLLELKHGYTSVFLVKEINRKDIHKMKTKNC